MYQLKGPRNAAAQNLRVLEKACLGVGGLEGGDSPTGARQASLEKSYLLG